MSASISFHPTKTLVAAATLYAHAGCKEGDGWLTLRDGDGCDSVTFHDLTPQEMIDLAWAIKQAAHKLQDQLTPPEPPAPDQEIVAGGIIKDVLAEVLDPRA